MVWGLGVGGLGFGFRIQAADPPHHPRFPYRHLVVVGSLIPEAKTPNLKRDPGLEATPPKFQSETVCTPKLGGYEQCFTCKERCVESLAEGKAEVLPCRCEGT